MQPEVKSVVDVDLSFVNGHVTVSTPGYGELRERSESESRLISHSCSCRRLPLLPGETCDEDEVTATWNKVAITEKR